MNRELTTIYRTLLAHYGPQHWWPSRSGTGWEIMMGAVLTQRTSWSNVEKSLSNIYLRWGLEGLSQPEAILSADDETLVQVLRPTGHFRSKPRKLRGLAQSVLEMGGVDALQSSILSTEKLRSWLLGIWGIGPETADAILLYALNRPIFVADAYALRQTSRWGLLPPNAKYEQIQQLFMENLAANTEVFNEYHALIVEHGKEICRPKPLCSVCPLNVPLSLGAKRHQKWCCPKLNTPFQGEGVE